MQFLEELEDDYRIRDRPADYARLDGYRMAQADYQPFNDAVKDYLLLAANTSMSDLSAANATASDEMYEGAVKLEVESNGAVKESIRFVGALRQNPQFHLLRMVTNARRDGMEVWIRLRSPDPLRTTLLALAAVNQVEAAECSESDPGNAVLRVSLG